MVSLSNLLAFISTIHIRVVNQINRILASKVRAPLSKLLLLCRAIQITFFVLLCVLVNNLIGMSPYEIVSVFHFVPLASEVSLSSVSLITLSSIKNLNKSTRLRLTCVSVNFFLAYTRSCFRYSYNPSASNKIAIISAIASLEIKRYYSTADSSVASRASCASQGQDLPKPLIRYRNSDTLKLKILMDSQGKSGVYMWTNQVNGKRYIGSSVDLKRRFLEYFNVNRLLLEESMVICKGLLKYGHSNFSLDILEYCSIEELMQQEKYYIDLLKPEYNILKIPGSPSRGKGWKHSEETIAKLKLAKSEEARVKYSQGQKTAQRVEVTDLELNTVTEYHAIRAAAKALGIDKRYIEHYIYLDQTEAVSGRYIFKKIGESAVKLRVQQRSSQTIEVTDLESNTVTVYPSIGLAARALGGCASLVFLYTWKKIVKNLIVKDIYLKEYIQLNSVRKAVLTSLEGFFFLYP